jgi:hypothetical protein
LVTCGLGQRPPAPLAVRLDVGDEALVLLLGPGALVGVRLLAARGPPHAAACYLVVEWRVGEEEGPGSLGVAVLVVV